MVSAKLRNKLKASHRSAEPQFFFLGTVGMMERTHKKIR